VSEYLIRWATADDTERLAALADLAHGADEADGHAPWVAQWVRDLMSPAHPTGAGTHMALVEHTSTGQAVSMACVIPQTWTVAGQPVQVGRLEAFGTHPDHRRRGLVRQVMAALHERGDELGCHLVVISGLSWFYRQFGYDYALEHEGGMGVPIDPAAAEVTGITVRPLVDADLAGAAARYDRDGTDSHVWCPRSDALWCQALHGHHDPSHEAERWWAIERHGHVVGHLAHSPRPTLGALVVTELMLDDPGSDPAVGPAVVAALAASQPDLPGVYLRLGSDHPIYHHWPPDITLPIRPYAWFVRVPDWVRLFRALGPALRTECSTSLSVGEYVSGVRWHVGPDGLTAVEPWSGDDTDASFPPGTLAKLVFGYRNLDQLLDAYPDADGRTAADTLRHLFPRRRSFVRPVS
jgi:predicted N-acetyltransferase YhbS